MPAALIGPVPLKPALDGESETRNQYIGAWGLCNSTPMCSVRRPGHDAGEENGRWDLYRASQFLSATDIFNVVTDTNGASLLLNASAAMSGVTVQLSSDQPGVASVPASVVVPAGFS